MDSEYQQLKKEHLFLRLHPTVRFFISLGAGIVAYMLLSATKTPSLLKGMFSWIAFAYSLIGLGWAAIAARSTARIREFARREDGSRAYVFLVILLACFASMILVAVMILSKDAHGPQQTVYLVATVAGMLGAWIMLHTTFTFHYAHMYYDDDDTAPNKHAEGLEFPNQKKPDYPDYLDFAYFSFVIGMTFQVSDVEISGRRIRRLVLLHGLISFLMNTFVVALTVNIIAGLKA